MLRTLLLPLALLLSAAACQTGPLRPSPPFPYTEFVSDGSTQGMRLLEEVQPSDVLVAPVHDQSPAGTVPVDRLRTALMETLVDRLYSPLAAGFVDARPTEAGYDPTQASAEGVLQVVVTRWDTSLLRDNGAVEAEVEARLLDGTHPARPVLWGVSLGRRLDASAALRGQLDDQELLERAAGELADEILALLPARDPSR